MKLLWTHSNNIMDWIISFLTGEDCQHFAILFEAPTGGGLVFQINLLGGGVTFYKTFLNKHKIIHSLDFKVSLEDQNELWDEWVDRFDGKPYNILGALYLGLMKFRKRIFGTALPTVNAWSQPGDSFCDEAYQLISYLPEVPDVTPSSNGMMTPHDLWLVVSAKVRN